MRRSVLDIADSGLDSALSWMDDIFERPRQKWRTDIALGLSLLAPSMVLLAVFGIWPLVRAWQMSLFGGKHGMGTFVGWANYREALSSPGFWKSFSVTVYYALGTIPLAMLLSFCMAFAVSRIVRGRVFFRMAFFLPYVTSAVAAAMVWRALFNAQHGVMNMLLEYAGFNPQQWLLEPRGILHLLSGGHVPVEAGPSLALCCIIAFDIWHNSGFMMVVFLAGLTSIPRELEEAARIDGANTVRVIRHITLPLLSPTIFFLLIVSAIRAFQAFNSFYALTQGGGRALGTTENLIMHIYANFYEFGYWGYGSAVATLLSFAIIVLTALQWWWVGKRVHYA